MPVNNASNIGTTVAYGTQLTIHTAVATAIAGIVGTIAEIHSITITRKAVGNNFVAVIVYETQ